MNKKHILIGALALVVVVAGALYVFRDSWIKNAGLAINVVRSSDAPEGALTIEVAPATQMAAPTASASSSVASIPLATSLDWPSYNRTLTSERYSPLREITRDNVGQLQVLCTYDTREHTSFQTGPLVVNGALIGTTEHDIFSIDPATCRENWRTHEDYQASQVYAVNRGAAYLDGLLFRGTTDGRVLAYDFKTGKRLWATLIGDASLHESTPAAPIAWNGLVFIGNAGGDQKGSKGRMYALDAKTGKIVWEFYLVPKGQGDVARGPQGKSPLDTSTWGSQAAAAITGGATWTSYTLNSETAELYIPGGNPAPDFALGPRDGPNLYSGSVVVLDAKTGDYIRHYKIVPKDWHDWDVSNPPALIQTRAGKRLLVVTPKDGHLYGFDLSSDALLYRMPVNRIEDADVPFSTEKPVHFCPGTAGGAEWNGPGYDPRTNLILIGEVEWCGTVRIQTDDKVRSVKRGEIWSGMQTDNPYDTMSKFDPKGQWAGWLYASDADTGAWKWRAKSNYPIQSGITPTAGGVVFFGDMGGYFYALDSSTGQRLWSQPLDGAIGGGVITYFAGGTQKVAVAAGFTSIIWPTKVTTGKIVIFGLPGARIS